MVGRSRVCREDELLLLLARGTLTPEVQEKALACLQQELSWPLILKQALLHGVSPLLYRNLLALGFPDVPTEVRTTLDRLYKTNAVRNLLLARDLARVLQAFSAVGIPVVPLKGVALAESLYGDPALRICSDIDILVPRRMAAEGFELLLTAGYEAGFSERFFAELLLRHDTHYALARRERQFFYHLELHWGILWGPRLDEAAINDLWVEARPQPFFGQAAYALSPEWDLLYLALHAARHCWQGLKWLVDIHEMCSRRGVDWEKVRGKAEALGYWEVVRITLSACHTLFDTPVPEDFSIRRLPSWLKMFPTDPSPSDTWKDAIFPIRLFRRPSEKISYLARILLVPTLAERQALRLPSFLGFLYYPLRPLRLAYKWGWRLVRAVSAFLRGSLWWRKHADGAAEARPAPLQIPPSAA